MSIQDWGAIGELISAVAVLITLVYLALQIRQNTRALRAQTRSEISQHAIEHILFPVNPETLGELLIKDIAGQELSEWELRQVNGYWSSLFRRWENFHYQHRMGLFDDSEFEAHLEVWRSLVRGHARIRVLREDVRPHYSKRFAAQLGEIIEEVRQA